MYQLIQTGEETGTLNIMMTKLAHLYEEDVNAAFEKLHHLLEPFIMSILGIFVGGLVIALYLPIFKLGTAI
jgi:type IV pilus assembly protein PilC